MKKILPFFVIIFFVSLTGCDKKDDLAAPVELPEYVINIDYQNYDDVVKVLKVTPYYPDSINFYFEPAKIIPGGGTMTIEKYNYGDNGRFILDEKFPSLNGIMFIDKISYTAKLTEERLYQKYFYNAYYRVLYVAPDTRCDAMIYMSRLK